jgi:hypothetical protein
MNRELRSLKFTLTILFITSLSTHSQSFSPASAHTVLIMQETGEIRDGLPVMELVPETDTRYSSVHQSIESSFLDRFLGLYRLCQCYLIGEGVLQDMEPAYLALTDHQGGFARQGFILQTKEGELVKEEVPYVDITVQAATSDIYGLMSFTQLFPHEMAHVMYRLLSREDSVANNSRSVDMHYFSIITDYPTAFNEGFAEHMENVSRHFEENDSIRAGFEKDLQQIEASSGHSIDGFTRDFIYPFRMGFYKAGMISWYQKFEDYKRAEDALSGRIRYKNKSLRLRNPEDRLTYRNAGIAQQEELRNIVQFHSTEGAISAFFTALSLREPQHTALSDSLISGLCTEKPVKLDPLQKQFLKYFHVIHHYVVRNNSCNSQFSDFISGYLDSYPEDKADVLRIYSELTGQKFTPGLPASIWLMVTDYRHRLLVLDPFGAIEVPLYTFNLNAAEVDDLLTISGLTAEEAEAIISYRVKNGFFNSLDDLNKIPNLSPETAGMIGSLAFEQSEFEQIMDGFDPELTISGLLITPLLRVGSKALLYYVLIFLLIVYLLNRRDDLRTTTLLRISLRYLFLWLGLVILELILLFLFPQSWGLALLPVLISMVAAIIIYRRRREKRNFTLSIVSLMFLVSLISVF